MFAEGGGDREFLSAQEVEGGGAEGGEGLRGRFRADAARVFAEGHVEHVKCFVFDVPAAAEEPEKNPRGRSSASQAGDRIGHRSRGFAVQGDFAFQPDHLLGPGPVEIARFDQIGRGGDGACFQAAAAFLGCGGCLSASGFLLNSRGGKSLSGSRRLGRCLAGEWVGSP